MKALASAGSWIEVDKAEFVVGFTAENVGVAANEEIGFLCQQKLSDAFGISSGMSADVGHKHFESFAFELLMLWVLIAKVRPVDVSPYRAKRFKIGEFLSDIETPNVSGVPDLIALLKMVEKIGSEVTVSIRNETYAQAYITSNLNFL